MSTDAYKVSPGDLITAKLFNGLQDKISHDTAEQIKNAIKAITNAPHADDAGRLGGKTPGELEKTIIDQVLAKLAKKTGYRLVMKRLQTDEWDTVQHDLGAFPLVDAYQLDYFEVVCADGEDKENKFVNFYLYHSTETEQKSAVKPAEKRKIFIEKSDGSEFVFKIRFEEMLKWYEIPCSDSSQSIGDLVAEFWQQLFKKPNDNFDVDQYCNSAWFEKCCGDNRSIGLLKQRNDWDELWFQMRARKTINLPAPLTAIDATPAMYPNNLEVVQLDFNNIGVRLIGKPYYDKKLIDMDARNDNNFAKDELKVMLLLKV
jgi:hypothetical protein